MFGWSNLHSHCAEVVSHVVMHDPNGDLAGTMKRWGRKPMLGEYLGGEEEEFGDRISWRYERDDNIMSTNMACAPKVLARSM